MKGSTGKDGSQLQIGWDAETIHEAIRQVVKARLKGSMMLTAACMMEEEVQHLCGKSKSRKKGKLKWRGGSEEGSIYLDGQRAKIRRPRVRDEHGEVPLEHYRALQVYDLLCEEVTQKVLRGISSRDYTEAISEIENGLGLGKSSVSRAFIAASRKELDEINTRTLSGYEWVAIFIDGIEFSGVHIIVALGVTSKGQKLVLGLREGATENAEVCKDLLESLESRGLEIGNGVLAVIDGAKALKAAIERMYGSKAVIQRCQIHKIRNVLSYLPDRYHGQVRRMIRNAYGMKRYEDAKRELEKVIAWLGRIAEGAARSLEEGLEETLTVHRLEMPEILRRTFSSTNLIESTFSSVSLRTRRVTNWRKGTDQACRWVAASLLLHEKRFKRVKGYREIPIMMMKLGNLIDSGRQVA